MDTMLSRGVPAGSGHGGGGGHGGVMLPTLGLPATWRHDVGGGASSSIGGVSSIRSCGGGGGGGGSGGASSISDCDIAASAAVAARGAASVAAAIAVAVDLDSDDDVHSDDGPYVDEACANSEAIRNMRIYHGESWRVRRMLIVLVASFANQ